jgi:hypothetical protein
MVGYTSRAASTNRGLEGRGNFALAHAQSGIIIRADDDSLFIHLSSQVLNCIGEIGT